MNCYFFQLNSDKTEVLILCPEYLQDALSNDIAILDGIALDSSETIRNLGVIFYPDFICRLSATLAISIFVVEQPQMLLICE